MRKIKKVILYTGFILLIIWGEFVSDNGLLTGSPPSIKQSTLAGSNVKELIAKGPAIIYVWAEWCGICKMMQSNITAVLMDHPGVTLAVKSGDAARLTKFMQKNNLNWQVINDPEGLLSEQFKVSGVPAVFFLNQHGQIVLNTVGYVSEIGLRFRLWLSRQL